MTSSQPMKTRWRRLTQACQDSEMEEDPDAEVLGVCRCPGCAVPDAGCAKTLIDRLALDRHAAVAGIALRWLPGVSPVQFKGLDGFAQQSEGAVELDWYVGSDMIRFLNHVIPGNIGLLLSRTELSLCGNFVCERHFLPVSVVESLVAGGVVRGSVRERPTGVSRSQEKSVKGGECSARRFAETAE